MARYRLRSRISQRPSHTGSRTDLTLKYPISVNFCSVFNAKIDRNVIYPVVLINKGRNFPGIDFDERENKEADLLSV